ncbi:MAG: CdaR family protein [Bdellovibrionales bacterium]
MKWNCSLTNPSHVISNKVRGAVKVKLSGPRSGLKKFTQSDEVISLNLEKLQPGRRTVKIPKEAINLPLGVKAVLISPSRVQINLKEVHPSNEGGE